MAKSKLVKANEKIAEKVVNGYKKIEETVVGGYKKIEEGAVNGFTQISDSFVDEFLTKEGETVEEAKARLAAEQREREAGRWKQFWRQRQAYLPWEWQSWELRHCGTSAGEGISELFTRTAEVLKTLPKEDIIDIEDKVVYTLKDEKEEFKIEIIDGDYVVTGPAVERLMGRVNIGDNESMAYLQNTMRKIGIEDKLREMEIKEGDTVKMLEWEFEWYN